jgi:hypothetical protein
MDARAFLVALVLLCLPAAVPAPPLAVLGAVGAAGSAVSFGVAGHCYHNPHCTRKLLQGTLDDGQVRAAYAKSDLGSVQLDFLDDKLITVVFDRTSHTLPTKHAEAILGVNFTVYASYGYPRIPLGATEILTGLDFCPVVNNTVVHYTASSFCPAQICAVVQYMTKVNAFGCAGYLSGHSLQRRRGFGWTRRRHEEHLVGHHNGYCHLS